MAAFHEAGLITGRDWQALQELLLTLRTGRLRSCSSAGEVARAAGCDDRTLRRRVERYLGIPFADAITRPGWEPALEAALRACCRFPDAGVTKAAS